MAIRGQETIRIGDFELRSDLQPCSFDRSRQGRRRYDPKVNSAFSGQDRPGIQSESDEQPGRQARWTLTIVPHCTIARMLFCPIIDY